MVAAAGHRDVFLSYRGRDREVVEHIARRLVEARLQPWFDRWSQTAGRSWQHEIGHAIDEVDAVAVFVGPGRLGAWEREEVAVALERAAADSEFRVFPVLLPGVPDPFDPNELPHFLRTRTWVDLRSDGGTGRCFEDLVCAVKGLPFGPRTLAQDDAICPFRGLQVFEERHADFFFGREGDVQRMLERLKKSRVLAVLGPSGSGKSSLVRAGLLPALRQRPSGFEDGPFATVLRPGAQPLASLAASLAALSATRAMQATLDSLAEDPRTLHHALRLAHVGHPDDEPLTLCIDQFEEAFTLCDDDAQRSAYFANIVEAATAPGCPALIVLTLRADFYERLARHRELAQLVSAHQYLVGPLTVEGLRAAIEEPARRVSLRLEPGLTDTILADVGDEPGTLPLLEHALLELWKRRRGHLLSLEGYRASGGVEEALTQAAERVFAEFDPDEQELTRRLLLRLTQPGDGAQDTRRRASLREVTPAANRVMTQLAEARLITVSGGEVEVAHETLVRCWGRLRGWIEADREGLRVSRRLTAAANEWARRREPDSLYGRSSLAIAEDWAEDHPDELSDDERAFLAASRSKERRRTVFRVYANVLLVSALVTIAIAVVALDQRHAAVRQRAVALSGSLAARALRELDSAPERSVSLATQALADAQTDDAEFALRRAVNEQYEITRMTEPPGAVTVAPGTSALPRDGRLLVTASDRGGVAIWDVASGRLVRRLRGPRKGTAAAFGPNGRSVLTTQADEPPYVWDVHAGKIVHILRGARVSGATISPDGRWVIGATHGRDVAMWSVTTGRLVRRLRQPQGVTSARFSPNGRTVLTASRDGVARVWELRNGRMLRQIDAGGWLTGAIFSPDGRRVALTRHDGTVQVVELRTLIATTLTTRKRTETVTFSPDSRSLVTTSDTSARVWDVRTGKNKTLTGHQDFVDAAAFSPDGQLIVTASDDTTARIWDATTGRALRILRGHTDAVTAAFFTPDGARVVTASLDGTARVWDADVGTVLRGSRGWVLGTAFDRTGLRAATADDHGIVGVWDTTTGARQVSMRYPGDHRRPPWIINSVAFGGDRWLVTAAGNDTTGAGRAMIWSASTGALRRAFPPHGRSSWIASAAMSPNGRDLATAGDDGAQIWDARRGVLRRRLRGHTDSLTDVAFSRDGRMLVTASLDGTARVWRTATGSAVAVLRASPSHLASASFSPDGRMVVTTGYDRVARIWSVPAGSLLHTLRGHASAVYDAAFTARGDQVVTVGNDGTTRIWDTRTGAPLAVLHVHSKSANTVAVAGDRIISGSDDGTARIYRCRACGSLSALRASAAAYLARVADDSRAVRSP